MRHVAQNKKRIIILSEIDCFEDLDMGFMRCEGADWIDLAQDRAQWRAVVNTVKELRVPPRIWKSFSCRATSNFLRTPFCS